MSWIKFNPWPLEPTWPDPVVPWWPSTPAQPLVQPQTTHHHYHFTPNATPPKSALSDADVDRIARRLAEILREPKP